ncbi:MAG: chlorite dismutase family protein [Deltaproteobacteria bacterium]|nr:chlorite dismutase family protein [Deltaproteobacteria bacterium]
MADALVPSSGWTVSHRFYRIHRTRWRALAAPERAAAVAELRAWLAGALVEEGLQLVPLALVGKGDVGLMAVHPDLRRHQQLAQELAATALGACLEPVYTFLSISEASEYVSSEADWARTLVEEQKIDPTSPDFTAKMETFRKRIAAYAEARMYPRLPDNFPIVCFYPMAKAREAGRNWYALSFDERKKLMQGHGDSGRRYASRVTQLITSATGLDDWEWGVTLFAGDLRAIRDVVYEMRFDAASALYGLFGAFYIGVRFTPEELPEILRL